MLHSIAVGGTSPRHFALNALGDRIAIAVQREGMIVVFERNVETGMVGDMIAVKGELGQECDEKTGVVCVLWDETNTTDSADNFVGPMGNL